MGWKIMEKQAKRAMFAALRVTTVQEVIVSERRFQYEAEVKADPQNYDSWFDYARLEESAGDHEKVTNTIHSTS